ncbi:MAG: four helix bundle protein [candidate division SR1 bacterium]|nr:four helix bundle protein [candidate division SR1 bacterium]
MKIEKFEDLIAWQKAKELTTKLYVVCKNCKEYGLKDIMTKTGIIMMNQIAEGFEKRNNKDIKAAFLIAKGGSSQMRSMLYMLLELGCITQEEFKDFYDITWHITKMLMAFVKSINANEKKAEDKKAETTS